MKQSHDVKVMLNAAIESCGGHDKWCDLLNTVRPLFEHRDRSLIIEFARRAVRTDAGAVQLAVLMLLGLTVGDVLYRELNKDEVSN